MKAVVLLSGGIDSAVMLALALKEGKECIALSFDYGQRHRVELKSAKRIAEHYGVEQKLVKIDASLFLGTALVGDQNKPVSRSTLTYVPGRNTLFVAFASSLAEGIGAREIHIGPNRDDYFLYPDCRPEYLNAFQNLLNLSSKKSVEGFPTKLVAPLIGLNKGEIVKIGRELNVPLELTHSCYFPDEDGKPCKQCDACFLRFAQLNELMTIEPFSDSKTCGKAERP